MGRVLILIFGVLSYVVGLGGLSYFFLYVGGWEFLPLHVNSGTPGPVATALLVNTALMLIWGLQHSIMARDSFKESWIQIVPVAIERSTYVLLSGILMVAICLFWQALPGLAWHIENPIVGAILIVLHVSGWVIAVTSSFLINHFELFGLQQVYLAFTGKPEPARHFVERSFYKIVRHPLQFGILLGMWSAPSMSMTRLCLAAMMTVYIYIGLYFEEKTLLVHLGQDYENYRSRVRKLLPIPE